MRGKWEDKTDGDLVVDRPRFTSEPPSFPEFLDNLHGAGPSVILRSQDKSLFDCGAQCHLTIRSKCGVVAI